MSASTSNGFFIIPGVRKTSAPRSFTSAGWLDAESVTLKRSLCVSPTRTVAAPPAIGSTLIGTPRCFGRSGFSLTAALKQLTRRGVSRRKATSYSPRSLKRTVVA
jgi:hypothetical protein